MFNETQRNEIKSIVKEMMLQERIANMAELIATDPKIDRDLLKSMNPVQLGKYKAELARKAAAKRTTKTSAQLAEELYGKVEK